MFLYKYIVALEFHLLIRPYIARFYLVDRHAQLLGMKSLPSIFLSYLDQL